MSDNTNQYKSGKEAENLFGFDDSIEKYLRDFDYLTEEKNNPPETK